jgi:hypothetical protein
MNKEQQELLDESYKDYFIKKSSETGPFGVAGIIPTKDEFINNCKNNPEFSEKWGLKIEERELSLEERYDLIEKDKHTQFVKWESLGTDRIREVLDDNNIPTKLITITYNNETIESYE